MKFVSNPESAGEGFDVIRTTVSGKSPGNIKGLGFLAFRRAPKSSMTYIDGEPMLFDICVSKKSLREELPDKYLPIERDVSMTMT